MPTLVRRLSDPDQEYAEPPELDLRGHLFAFPGGRPGRRFTELLVQEAEDRALRLTAPRVIAVGALPELLYRPAGPRPAADLVLSRQLWARALREIPRNRLGILVPEAPRDDDRLAWMALADEVMRLHADVTREGLDFGAVANRCGGDLLFDDSRRWTVLARVRAAYLESLESLGLEDRDEARISALEEGRVGIDEDASEPVRQIHLVGISDMPGVAREMLRRVVGPATPVTAWIKAPDRLAHRFDDVGCVDPDAWAEVEIPVPDEALSIEDGPGDQATATLRAIDGFDGAYAAEEITVGVPDEEVVPWLEQRFRRHDLPHRVARGTPLERTSVFRLLTAVADYLDGRRFVDLAALLRHPDLGRHLDGGRTLEIADRYRSDHLPARIDGDMPRSRRRSRHDAETSIEALVERLHGPDLLGPLADRGDNGADARRPLSAWMVPLLDLVDRIFGGADLSRRDPGQRILLEACEELRDTAAAFHRLPGEADPECDAPQAIRLLLGQLRASGTPIPPDPDRGAIEILGWLELHLDDAPALIVTGMNEGFVPESVNAHPFLPNSLRSALGLVDNRARWARDAYLLSALLESREEVCIVAGRTGSSGDPLRPSRLLLTVRGESLARRVLRFTEPKREPTPAVVPPGLTIPAEGAFTTPPEPTVQLEAVPETFSVTEFRTLLQDPYRWFLEKRLGLDSLHDQIRELDPLGFGSLAHDVLKTFAESEEASASDPGAVAHRLDEILDAAARRRFGSSPVPSVPLQIEQLRRRLHAFAEWQASRISAGWRVVATEVGTPEKGVPLDVDGQPVRIRGRIDRIEIHEESGEVAIFDYKTGDRVRDPESTHRSRSGEWQDLQLPLYRHLLSHLRLPGGGPLVEASAKREIHLGYIRLPKEAARVGAALAPWSDAELESALERARDLIRSLRDDAVILFDRERTRTNRWDPLGPLLGRGILSLASPDDEEEE